MSDLSFCFFDFGNTLIHLLNLLLELDLDLVEHLLLLAVESWVLSSESLDLGLALLVLFLRSFKLNLKLLDFGFLFLDPVFEVAWINIVCAAQFKATNWL